MDDKLKNFFGPIGRTGRPQKPITVKYARRALIAQGFRKEDITVAMARAKRFQLLIKRSVKNSKKQ